MTHPDPALLVQRLISRRRRRSAAVILLAVASSLLDHALATQRGSAGGLHLRTGTLIAVRPDATALIDLGGAAGPPRVVRLCGLRAVHDVERATSWRHGSDRALWCMGRIRVIADPNSPPSDGHEPAAVYVWSIDGDDMLNEWLIRQGHAQPDESRPHPYAVRFKQARARAGR